MNIKELEKILGSLKIGVTEHYQYKLVSPVDIIRSRRGPLNLGSTSPIGMQQTRINKRLGNQRLIEQYLTEMGMVGWKLCTKLDYEGLPNNGSMIFKKKYFVEDENPEETTKIADFKENLDKGNLYQEFEQETGKHAVFNNKVTKNYLNWVANRNGKTV